MYCVRKVTEDLYWVGGNDRRLTLFENIHPIPRGVSYNSYLLLDEKTVLFDTVDWSAGRQFLENIEYVLDGRQLDYLVINHMEPDHGASIEEVLIRYPDVKIISTEKAFMMMHQFNFDVDGHMEEVQEGDTRSFGKHEVTFVAAPMVHWPEAMVTFDLTNGVLFAADAFGSFGSLDGKLFNDEVNFDRDWIDDARRYYTNIVGKYGPHVQALLKKAATIDIKMICPLHGPVWRSDLGYFLDKYDKWSSYEPEEKAVMIAYGSIYGNTENAANILACRLADRGVKNIVMYDVSSTHPSVIISEAFRCSHLIFASATYNGGIFSCMEHLLLDLKAHNLQNRTVALLENGSWGVTAGRKMGEIISEMKNMTILDETITIKSSLKEDQMAELGTLANIIVDSMN